MAESESTTTSAASGRILKLLEGLSATPTGRKVYAHVRHNLEQLELGCLQSEQAHLELLQAVVDLAAAAYPEGSEQRVELQIIRHTLIPGLGIDELKSLTRQIEQLAGSESGASGDFLSDALAPLLLAQNNPQALRPMEGADDDEALLEPGPHQVVAPQIDLLYQHQLDRTRDSIRAIQNQLAEELLTSMQLNDELSTLIADTMETLRQFELRDESAKRLRSSYLHHCQNLMEKHKALVNQLDRTYNKLHLIEAAGARLDDELTHLHRLSLTDELTGLPNRRAIQLRLEEEVARARRYDTPLALAIIDLDRFKQINDRYGHPAGDTILQCFASKLLSVFRHHDTTARFGGEEFAVLMPNTDIDGAFKAMEKIRYLAKESRCLLDNGEEIPLPTFSAGIALYTPDETPDELIRRADSAMYRAKQMGRARIEVHSTVPPHNGTPTKAGAAS